jgi:uncharacterized protein YndB with AHSA1/START domain
MSMDFEYSVEINAPPGKVWPVIIDVENWSKWTASITEIKLLDAGEIKVGTRARVRQPRLPTVIWQVTQFVPDKGFVWENRALGARAVGEHWITSSEGGRSRVVLKIRQSGFIAWVLSPLTTGLVRRYMTMEKEGLKRQCEASQ